jgi:hypothetical protein
MQYLPALISCIKIARPSADAGHDMGCFRNATDGKCAKSGQVSFAGLFVLKSGSTRLRECRPMNNGASSASPELRVVWDIDSS